MRTIQEGDKVIAVIFDKKFEQGSKPLTEPSWPLQILSLTHPKGKVWPAHIHKPVKRTTDSLLEALVVISGKVKIDLFLERTLKESLVLAEGEGIMVVEGVFRMEALEDVVLMEFKNGPFVDDKVFVDTA